MAFISSPEARVFCQKKDKYLAIANQLINQVIFKFTLPQQQQLFDQEI
ncbi:MAG: hypothetical protein AAFQ14_01960 [Cyanobacteria bacterium J06621_12]